MPKNEPTTRLSISSSSSSSRIVTFALTIASRVALLVLLCSSRRVRVPVRVVVVVDALVVPPAAFTSSFSSFSVRRPMTSVDDDVRAYNEHFSASVAIGRVDASPSSNVVDVVRRVRDVDRDETRSLSYRVDLSRIDDDDDDDGDPPPVEISPREAWRATSPSGRRVARLTTRDDGASSSSWEVEIWDDGGRVLSRRCALPAPTLHGKVCADASWFGVPSWSPDETTLVYAAEERRPETTTFFDRPKPPPPKGKRTNNDDAKVTRGGRFALHEGVAEDWGEKYVGTSTLGLFLLNVDTGEVGRVDNVPENVSLGQPVFTPGGKGLVYVGWDTLPRRLGSIYCYQRPCALYYSRVEAVLTRVATESTDETKDTDEEEEKDPDPVRLTPDMRLARSPRFGPPGDGDDDPRLVFLGSADGFDTHNGCVGLHLLSWNRKTDAVVLGSRRELVPEIDVPSTDDDAITDGGVAFPGLYTNNLVRNPFSPDGAHVFLDSVWGCASRVLRVAVDGDGHGAERVVPLRLANDDDDDDDGPNRYGSERLWCVSAKHGLIAERSAPNRPAVLVRVLLDDALADDVASRPARARTILRPAPVAVSSFSRVGRRSVDVDPSSALDYEILSTPVDDAPDLPAARSILLTPRGDDDGPIPLIVVPHGGPHSCTTTTHLPSYAFLCARGGYAILHVDFRGSTGLGRRFLERDGAPAGTADVDDVIAATERALSSYPRRLDPDRVGVCGGSHGGFLGAHLIGRRPDLFRVACLRNPVTNVASMVTATDIPDWCRVETTSNGYDFSSFRGPTRDETTAMYDASPIRYVDRARAPTLVALGMADRRVPPSQGLEYYHALRAAGVPIKLLSYEKDDHAIDRPVSEADHWIHIKRWFDDHL